MSQMIDQLKRFLEFDPSDSFTRFALALEYIKTGELQSALDLFVYIRSNDPGYTGVYYHLGKLYEQLGMNGEAAITYKTGIAMAAEKQDFQAEKELREALISLEDD